MLTGEGPMISSWPVDALHKTTENSSALVNASQEIDLFHGEQMSYLCTYLRM